MPIPPGVQPRTPPRATSGYSVGKPDLKPDLSTVATMPTISSPATNPAQPVVLGVDAQTASKTVGALAAGASVSIDLTIALPNIPGNLTFAAVDKPYLICNATAYHAIVGLTLASLQVIPRGVVGVGAGIGGSTVFGAALPTNVQITSWACEVKATFTAVTATSSGAVNIGVTANLYDLAG